jgi:CRISPR-associated protein Csd1
MGDALISFDKEAFCSYGLSQGENAAISESAALTYSAALNDLIRKHGRRLINAKVVHWFRNRVPVEDDVLGWLVNATGPDEIENAAQHRASRLLHAIRTGTRPDLASNRYFAITISGAAGRVMVRDWMEGSFEELAGSIARWFWDLEIAHRDGQGRVAPPPKFLALLGATARDLKDASPSTEVGLWRAAVRRTPIPHAVMALTLGRSRLDIVTGETLRHERFALLKAYHVRKGDSYMHAALNEQHPAPAYHCGRLMAVLAALQRRALPGVEAGVVQRYYAAASVTPALVLGRLVRTAQFHLNKLDGGLAHWYENRLADVWSRVGDTVPRTLSIEEQSLFALGYYHQLAYDRRGPSSTTPERGENAEEASHV